MWLYYHTLLISLCSGIIVYVVVLLFIWQYYLLLIIVYVVVLLFMWYNYLLFIIVYLVVLSSFDKSYLESDTLNHLPCCEVNPKNTREIKHLKIHAEIKAKTIMVSPKNTQNINHLIKSNQIQPHQLIVDRILKIFIIEIKLHC